MIVSHRHGYVFVKTAKTAGTSVEIALSASCGPEDVITEIAEEDEQLRLDLGYRGPQNNLSPSGDPVFFNHMSLVEARERIDVDGYFTFCFERNPWDRVISQYYWATRARPNPPSLSDFLRSDAVLILRRRGLELYTVDGEVAVDRICRYEQLEDDLNRVYEELRLPGRPPLPRAKGDIRKDRRHYRDVLSDEDAAVVAELFSREIELLGYTY